MQTCLSALPVCVGGYAHVAGHNSNHETAPLALMSDGRMIFARMRVWLKLRTTFPWTESSVCRKHCVDHAGEQAKSLEL
eukprot:scaffold13394_cov79-Phaeocystis_antarctica.AAC.1